MQDKFELGKLLWKGCNQIRSGEVSIKIHEAQPYLIGFIFFKFLSDNIEKTVNEEIINKTKEYKEDPNLRYKNIKDSKYYDDIKKATIDYCGYFIEYEDTFRSIIDDCDKKNEEQVIARLSKAFKNIEDSTIGRDSNDEFSGLFSNVKVDSSLLGSSTTEQTTNILAMLKQLDIPEMNLDLIKKNDILGDTYEFLISKFASESGEKAGEFYTPSFVSELLAKIVTKDIDSAAKIYDPTCGSGSLLIKVKNHLSDIGKLMGQEKNRSTYNMARMNLLLHNIQYHDFSIKCGDTLTNNIFEKEKGQIDLIVANPPFSLIWKPDEVKSDPRFNEYPKMAPKSTADFAFIQHMIYMLKEGGRCAVILPHGVLFRSNAEYHIRKYLVGYKKYLRAVIGLPANMFFNASIPTCILVFEKNTSNEDILFIEGSKEFFKDKKKNIMLDEHINKIFDTYNHKKTIDKFSRLVSLKEIEENDFNLNITRYIDTFEEEEEIDINDINQKIKDIDQQLIDVEKEIQAMILELEETE